MSLLTRAEASGGPTWAPFLWQSLRAISNADFILDCSGHLCCGFEPGHLRLVPGDSAVLGELPLASPCLSLCLCPWVSAAIGLKAWSTENLVPTTWCGDGVPSLRDMNCVRLTRATKVNENTKHSQFPQWNAHLPPGQPGTFSQA